MTPTTKFPITSFLPEVDTDQMAEVDRLMIEDYGINLFQMMENAGRSLAILARDQFLGANPRGKKIVVLAGSGGNGGGAITAARRLANWGADIYLGLTHDPQKMTGVVRQQYDTLLHITKVYTIEPTDISSHFDLIIDGMVGYSLKGTPRGHVFDFINAVNACTSPCLSLDVPSGYQARTGLPSNPTIHAHSTLTLALPKLGMMEPSNSAVIGRLYCADISVPPQLYRELDPPVEIAAVFTDADIVEIVKNV